MSPRWKAQSARERFDEKWVVDAETGCWLWINYDQERYPGFHLDGGAVGAHRAAWILYRGTIPADLQVDHLCRNKRCVNPDHLELVSSRENTMRGENQTARQARQTHCIRGHLLAGDNLIPNGRGTRMCRECHNATRRERYATDAVYREGVLRRNREWRAARV